MRFIAYFLFLSATWLPFNANAWFFFVPGSVVGAISDAITGDEGFHCVSRAAKVGDRIRTSTGIGIVKSISGESSRCASNLNNPIRAMLVPPDPNEKVSNTPSVNPSAAKGQPATSNAKLELSDDWEPRPLQPGQDPKVIVLFAANKTTNTALTLGTIKRSELGDISVFAKSRQAGLAANLNDPQLSPIDSLKIGDLPAWRYTVSGNAKRGKQAAWTYMVTIYEGRDEVVIVNTWTLTANFPIQQDEMHKIENGLTGITPP